MEENLYDIAEQNRIPVDEIRLDGVESLAVSLPEGSAILINPSLVRSDADGRVKLAHELGHCMTGAFYNVYSPLDNRRQKEVIADRWAIQALVPYGALIKACESGIDQCWELAEHFNVTEDFIRMAVEFYRLAG